MQNLSGFILVPDYQIWDFSRPKIQWIRDFLRPKMQWSWDFLRPKMQWILDLNLKTKNEINLKLFEIKNQISRMYIDMFTYLYHQNFNFKGLFVPSKVCGYNKLWWLNIGRWLITFNCMNRFSKCKNSKKALLKIEAEMSFNWKWDFDRIEKS